VRELKRLKTPSKESELLKEKKPPNRNHSQRVKELETKSSELTKTIASLENQAKSKTEPIGPQLTEIKTFTCAECQQTKPNSHSALKN